MLKHPLKKLILSLSLLVLVAHSPSIALAANWGTMGLHAETFVTSGEYMTERFAPCLDITYESPNAPSSFGLRLAGHFELWEGLMGGGLFGGVEQQLLPRQSSWHLGLFGGVESAIHGLSFHIPRPFAQGFGKIVYELGPSLGVQLIYKKPESSIGWVLGGSGSFGWRKFIDGYLTEVGNTFLTARFGLGMTF